MKTKNVRILPYSNIHTFRVYNLQWGFQQEELRTAEGYNFINEANNAFRDLAQSEWFRNEDLELRLCSDITIKVQPRLKKFLWKYTSIDGHRITSVPVVRDGTSWVNMMNAIIDVYVYVRYNYTRHGEYLRLQRTMLIHLTEKRFGVEFPKEEWADLEIIKLTTLVEMLNKLVHTKLAIEGKYIHNDEYKKIAALAKIDRIREERRESKAEQIREALEARAEARAKEKVNS